MSKKLINEIESKIAWNDKHISETDVSLRDVKRLLNELVKQAERVEELEKLQSSGKMHLHSVIHNLKIKLEGSERENEHYQEALEKIANHEVYGIDIRCGEELSTDAGKIA